MIKRKDHLAGRMFVGGGKDEDSKANRSLVLRRGVYGPTANPDVGIGHIRSLSFNQPEASAYQRCP